MSSYDFSVLVLARAVTAVHAGTGGRGAGIVDLPIQRDFAGYPCIWGSSVKGALRSLAERRGDSCLVEVVFGPEPRKAHEHAGSVVFSDLKLLALPGPCSAGVCYFTSPLLLEYFAEFSRLTGFNDIADAIEAFLGSVLSESRFISSSSVPLIDGKLFLHGIEVVDAVENPGLRDLFSHILSLAFNDQLSLTEFFLDRIVLVPEAKARDIIGRRLLQHVTRVALDYKTKTVRPGALWTEEYVPEFTLFSGVWLASASRKTGGCAGKSLNTGEQVVTELLGVITGNKPSNVDGASFVIVVGGHETIGKGVMRFVLRKR